LALEQRTEARRRCFDPGGAKNADSSRDRCIARLDGSPKTRVYRRPTNEEGDVMELQSVSMQSAGEPGALETFAPLDRLGEEIAELAAHLTVATARLLDLIREFDAQGGWRNGFVSCAAWLTWRVGLAPGAAREHVRVARALGTLPRLAQALARGELSYSTGGGPADDGAAAGGWCQAAGLDRHAHTAPPGWLGEHLDVGYAIDVLHPLAR
jgi:hypothetical protein